MKYKQFILLRNIGGIGVATIAAVGAFQGCRNAAQNDQVAAPVPYSSPFAPPHDPPIAVRPSGQNKPKASTKNVAQSVPTGATATLTARDTEIIRLRKEPLTNGKVSGDSTKWVAVGNGFKAEFRADTGSKEWDRVKVDLDNNKKWDERWDFKADGSIKRRVAPADDENYTAEYRLKSGETKWVRVK